MDEEEIYTQSPFALPIAFTYKRGPHKWPINIWLNFGGSKAIVGAVIDVFHSVIIVAFICPQLLTLKKLPRFNYIPLL